MFEKKLTSLIDNKFIKAATKVTNVTESGNGAMKYSTSGDPFVDQFASIATYKQPREFSDIASDMNILWSIDPLKALKFTVYIRLITRKSTVVNDNSVETFENIQKGQGLRHEGIMRMLWIAINYPNTFELNIPIFIAAGSWNDIFVMLQYDLIYHGKKNTVLDWDFFGDVIEAGLLNKNTTHLVRKYMPTIKSKSAQLTINFQANTIIGKWLAKRLFKNDNISIIFKQYRQFKSNGNAHSWQQLISKHMYDKINFDKIAGRALALLVGSKFLANHNLENKYSEWINNNKSGIKYTGFVFEIFNNLDHNTPKYEKDTINAQFKTLCQESIPSKLLVVRDISESMRSKAIGCNMTAYNIAKAMALYFSQSLTGEFANSYAVFSDEVRVKQWIGINPCDMWLNAKNENDFANTNFQCVIDLLVKLRKQGIPESDFPEGLLLISDGEFDRQEQYSWSGWNTDNSVLNETNFQLAFKKLGDVFSKEYINKFKLILWDIPNYYYNKHETKFEDWADAPNCFHISGYDPSVISFLLEGGEFKASPKNNKELLEAVLNQEILNKLIISD